MPQTSDYQHAQAEHRAWVDAGMPDATVVGEMRDNPAAFDYYHRLPWDEDWKGPFPYAERLKGLSWDGSAVRAYSERTGVQFKRLLRQEAN